MRPADGGVTRARVRRVLAKREVRYYWPCSATSGGCGYHKVDQQQTLRAE